MKREHVDRSRPSRSKKGVSPAAQPLLDWYNQTYEADPQRPVVSTLISAIVARLVAIIDLIAVKSPTSVPSNGQRLVTLMRELEELMSWLADPMNNQQGMALVTQQLNYYKNFLTIDQLEQLQMTARKRHRGRPIQKRTVAVKALETRLLTRPTKSYTHLARTLCDCGRSNHDLQCGERLRQQVRVLNSVLNRYGLTLKTPRK